MVELVAGDKDLVEAMKAAEEAGIDKAHLEWLLRQVAEGRYSDFYRITGTDDHGLPIYNTQPISYVEEDVKVEGGKTRHVKRPVYDTIPQMDAPKKHCRLVRIEHEEKPDEG